MGSAGLSYTIFYVILYVLIGIFGYYGGTELGFENYILTPPTLEIPEAPPPLFDSGGETGLTEFVILFFSWLAFLIYGVVLGLVFGAEILIYLLSMSGLSGFGLPAIWSVSISVVLTSALIFVLVSLWKGGS